MSSTSQRGKRRPKTQGADNRYGSSAGGFNLSTRPSREKSSRAPINEYVPGKEVPDFMCFITPSADSSLKPSHGHLSQLSEIVSVTTKQEIFLDCVK